MQYQQLRSSLIAADIPSSSENRQALVVATESWLSGLAAQLPQSGISLVAVGGLGRRELSAGSDLDLLLLYEAKHSKVAAEIADQIWYPIWDAGLKLDHSVRDVAQARNLAAKDFKVVLGLLDARSIAGDSNLVDKLRSTVLTDWRASALKRLPELFEDVQNRRQRAGDLAHLLEPELKDSYGGLRDLTVLRAIAASWVTDIDHSASKAAGAKLLEIRDALHRVSGRAMDRLTFHEQAAVAKLQGYEDDDSLLRDVSLASRAIAIASDQAWSRVQRQTVKPRVRKLYPRVTRFPLADGAVEQNGEVVLARDVNPIDDVALFMRVAAAAAQAGLPLAPHTIRRFVDEYRLLPVPWPSNVLNSFISLLGAGPALLPTWESLDQAGLFTLWLPHWEKIRSAPQRNALHQYTVDRHSVECVVQAAALTREVKRPDLLLVAALFHDIGKAQGPGHSKIGEKLMRQIAPTLGFDVGDTEVLAKLVLHHLLLAEVATARDLDDPATIEYVADAVGSLEVLQLLRQLTEADSRATNVGIWSDWKASLVDSLVARVTDRLDGKEIVRANSFVERNGLLSLKPGDIQIQKDPVGYVVKVCLTDRVGLVADIAGVWAISQLEVISADFDTIDGLAYQEWTLRPVFGDAITENELEVALKNGLANTQEIAKVLETFKSPIAVRRGFTPPAMRVKLLPNASKISTVLEVRAHDAPVLLYQLCRVVASQNLNIQSARIATLGSEIVDTLYIQAGNRELNSTESECLLAEIGSAIPAAR
jgi:[protein-PII] uridylyltransferase